MKKKKHAALQDSVRGYIRGISVAMLLQIQTGNSRVIIRSQKQKNICCERANIL